MNELMAGLTVRADQPASHFNLANVLLAQRRTSEALDAYRTAIGLQPDFVSAYINMAFAFNAQRASADAEKCLAEALKREPNSALILTNLGLLFADPFDGHRQYSRNLRSRGEGIDLFRARSGIRRTAAPRTAGCADVSAFRYQRSVRIDGSKYIRYRSSSANW